MFGHHSLSETSFGTDSIDLFFTPTGVVGTGSPANAEEVTVVATGSVSVLGVFANTGSAPVLGSDNLEFTFAKAEALIATLEESAQASASASLAAASQAQGILFQSQETDDLLSELSSVSSFSETNSTSGVAAENVQGRSLFGTMVATLNGSGVQTTNVGVSATGEIGQVIVWDNVITSPLTQTQADAASLSLAAYSASLTTAEYAKNASIASSQALGAAPNAYFGGNVSVTPPIEQSYSTVASGLTSNFSVVSPDQTSNFNKVTPNQSTSYTEETPSQTPSWDS